MNIEFIFIVIFVCYNLIEQSDLRILFFLMSRTQKTEIKLQFVNLWAESISLWSTGHDTWFPNGRTRVQILRSANAFEPAMTTVCWEAI